MFNKFLSKSISVKFLTSPPSIRGITIKKENLAAVVFSTPKKIANIIARDLINNNIFFCGIDLVSGYLIGDINITSPTGLPQYKDLTGINLAIDFWDNAKYLK